MTSYPNFHCVCVFVNFSQWYAEIHRASLTTELIMLSVKTYLTATGFPWYFKMFFFQFYSTCSSLFPARLCMCHVCVWYAWRLEYGNWLPGTSFMNDSVLPHGFQKTISNPLQKQYGIYKHQAISSESFSAS